MNSASTTNFLNSKGRRIYQGKSGGFFVMKADGTKKYKPTAAFRQVGNNGTKSKVSASNKNVPRAIVRKMRKNAGQKRGTGGRKPTSARGMMKAGMTPNEGNLTRMLLANYNKLNKARTAPKKARAPRKSALMKSPKETRPVLNLIVVSPGGTSRVQKLRKPRTTTGAANKPKKPRKTRKNKGVPRGPRGIKGIKANKNPYQALATK